MKPVIIIAIAVVLLIPIFAHADLNDLKKLIPDYYNSDENKLGESEQYKIIEAKIDKDGRIGLIYIYQFIDENMMWDMFKQFKMSGKFVNEITSFPATCFEEYGSDGNSKTIVCIKDDFLITVGTNYGESNSVMKQIFDKIDKGISLPSQINSKGGGCLIATATYGSELAPEVQKLRELRDNSLLSTESGTNFMNSFNDFYYSFSPVIADYERENPVFKEMVKITITPLLSSLSIMQYAETDSEVLGIGIGVIMMNLGMYFVAPAIVIVGIKRLF